MANLDFYAVNRDVRDILEFIYRQTDCRVFESHSAFGRELNEFKSSEEALATYEAGLAHRVRGYAILLELWSPSVSSRVNMKRINLDPRECDGHTFRFAIEGWGLMQLYLGGLRGREVSPSHFGHNSLERARKWEAAYLDELGPVADWDWTLLMKISRRIRYHVGSRMSVTKSGRRPVLRGAQAMVAAGGCELKQGAA